MSQLTIRAGRAYMVTSAEREAALGDLRDVLGQGGVDVDLEITHYVPGRRGLPPPWAPETVAIYIGGVAGAALITQITLDVYNGAKRWALKRYEAKRKAARDGGKDEDRVKGEQFTIYGPDNEVLKSWTVDKNGEHEADGE
jgi:hypothetical protein